MSAAAQWERALSIILARVGEGEGLGGGKEWYIRVYSGGPQPSPSPVGGRIAPFGGVGSSWLGWLGAAIRGVTAHKRAQGLEGWPASHELQVKRRGELGGPEAETDTVHTNPAVPYAIGHGYREGAGPPAGAHHMWAGWGCWGREA